MWRIPQFLLTEGTPRVFAQQRHGGNTTRLTGTDPCSILGGIKLWILLAWMLIAAVSSGDGLAGGVDEVGGGRSAAIERFTACSLDVGLVAARAEIPRVRNSGNKGMALGGPTLSGGSIPPPAESWSSDQAGRHRPTPHLIIPEEWLVAICRGALSPPTC